MNQTEYMLMLAQHQYSTEELNAFKKFLFLIYTTELNYRDVLQPHRFRIDQNCLIKKDSDGDQQITPLHPQAVILLGEVLELFKSRQLPTSNKKIRACVRKIAREIRLATADDTTTLHEISKFHINLYPGNIDIIDLDNICPSIGEMQNNLLSGCKLKQPSQVVNFQGILENLFAHPFYDCLKYIGQP